VPDPSVPVRKNVELRALAAVGLRRDARPKATQ
jgi:hypothetical protein